jgi:hypothetical protein
MLIPLFVKFGQMFQKLKNDSQHHNNSSRESQLEKPVMKMNNLL